MNINSTIKERFALDRDNLTSELLAGLTIGLVNIPTAIAAAVIAGVNPLFGLYTLMIATPVGALFTSSVFMNVSTTSAMAVAVDSGLTGFTGEERDQALFTLVLFVGLFQLGAGILRLGFLMRFVSHAVMTGFLTGVAILLVLGQVGDLTGYESQFENTVLSALSVLFNLGQIDWVTLVIGLLTILLILVLERTRLASFAMLLALIISTVLVQLLSLDSVAVIGDVNEIAGALPLPMLPDLSLTARVVDAAAAVAIIGLVQGAGISQSFANPDGKFPDTSGDFAGQGVANTVTSFFQGIPAGASLSGTALVVSAGGKSRWANIFSGLIVAVVVLLFAGAVELLPLSAVAALLIVIGVRIIDVEAIQTVWQTNVVARTAMLITLGATLTIPLEFAVFLGVAVSILMFVFQQSNRIKVTEIVPQEIFPEEREAPAELPSDRVTMLLLFGSLFFAAASTVEEKLPAADKAEKAVVIFFLRGRDQVGSTFLGVIQRYQETLQANGGKLILAEVSEGINQQLVRTGTLELIGEDNIFLADEHIGAAMNRAHIAAEDWLIRQQRNE